LKGIPSCPIDYRGRATTPLGRLWDRVQLVLARFLCGGWAARASRAIGLQPHVTIEQHTVELQLPVGPDLRIAFASDFHAGATTDESVLEDACRKLADSSPDVLLLGGDYVAFEAKDVEPLVPLLAQIQAPLGKFAVLGNHDHVTDERRIEELLADAGVMLLHNRSLQLAAPHDDIWICALDDPIHGDPKPETAFAGATGARIVLMHAPDGLLSIGDRAFSLALCGHTHGGQIVLPGLPPIVMPKGRLSRRYQGGTYQLGAGRTMVVSHGVGCSTLPIRFGVRPQVHMCVVQRRGIPQLDVGEALDAGPATLLRLDHAPDPQLQIRVRGRSNPDDLSYRLDGRGSEIMRGLVLPLDG
jgi:uncharacterized protein